MATEMEIRERNRALLHDLLLMQKDFSEGRTDAMERLIKRTMTYMEAEDVAYVHQMLGIDSNLPLKNK